jgi:uncharacterized protein YndB with AHSA1/START domain
VGNGNRTYAFSLFVTVMIIAAVPVSAETRSKADTVQQTLPVISNSAILNAPIKKVWEAWVTREGMESWLSPAAEIDPRPGGVYRAIYFPAATRPVDRGNDGKIIAMETEKMLSITWMTPIPIAELKGNSTTLVAYFHAIAPDRTRVDIYNFGYGQSESWKRAHDYNVKGWDRILSALEYRFEHGPMDWEKRVTELKETGRISYWRENRTPE